MGILKFWVNYLVFLLFHNKTVYTIKSKKVVRNMSDSNNIKEYTCVQKETIIELQKQIQQLITNDAVKNNEINNLKGDVETMAENINKLAEKLDRTFDKLDSNLNKIVWFGLSTSIGLVISITISIATKFIK